MIIALTERKIGCFLVRSYKKTKRSVRVAGHHDTHYKQRPFLVPFSAIESNQRDVDSHGVTQPPQQKPLPSTCDNAVRRPITPEENIYCICVFDKTN
ncbi:hypothetical protein FKM82_014357 [Ascaphus truei]